MSPQRPVPAASGRDHPGHGRTGPHDPPGGVVDCERQDDVRGTRRVAGSGRGAAGLRAQDVGWYDHPVQGDLGGDVHRVVRRAGHEQECERPEENDHRGVRSSTNLHRREHGRPRHAGRSMSRPPTGVVVDRRDGVTHLATSFAVQAGRGGRRRAGSAAHPCPPATRPIAHLQLVAGLVMLCRHHHRMASGDRGSWPAAVAPTKIRQGRSRSFPPSARNRTSVSTDSASGLVPTTAGCGC